MRQADFKKGAQPGMSLFELLVAVAVAGLLAVVTIPKISTPQAELQGSIIGKVDAVRTQMVFAMTAAQNNSDFTLPLTAASYETMFRKYGNYLTMKQVGGYRYYLLNDGSRLIFSGAAFGKAAFPDYTATSVAGLVNPATGTGMCGDYSNFECFYYDLNGVNATNNFGRRADLVPLRLDPNTGKLLSLYQWENELGTHTAAQVCSFDSVFDRYANGSTCP